MSTVKKSQIKFVLESGSTVDKHWTIEVQGIVVGEVKVSEGKKSMFLQGKYVGTGLNQVEMKELIMDKIADGSLVVGSPLVIGEEVTKQEVRKLSNRTVIAPSKKKQDESSEPKVDFVNDGISGWDVKVEGAVVGALTPQIDWTGKSRSQKKLWMYDWEGNNVGVGLVHNQAQAIPMVIEFLKELDTDESGKNRKKIKDECDHQGLVALEIKGDYSGISEKYMNWILGNLEFLDSHLMIQKDGKDVVVGIRTIQAQKDMKIITLYDKAEYVSTFGQNKWNEISFG